MMPAPSPNPPLSADERRALLALARRSMELGVTTGEITRESAAIPSLSILAGAFVTLHLRKRLRGCIGQLPGTEPLWYVVAYCAKAAALEDPRFEPVRSDELAEIEIEISVLSQPLDTLPEMIEAGKHGIIVSRGAQRGVLLPQVASQFHWDSARFLEETCVKAGFARDAWKDPGTRIQTFTAEVFSEADFRGEKGSGEPSQGSPRN
jgi:AmmeMemoRadiSam system protein A